MRRSPRSSACERTISLTPNATSGAQRGHPFPANPAERGDPHDEARVRSGPADARLHPRECRHGRARRTDREHRHPHTCRRLLAHHLTHSARSACRGDLRGGASGRRVHDRGRCARAWSRSCSTSRQCGLTSTRELPQAAVRTEGGRFLWRAGAPRLDRAARHQLGLPRGGRLRRAARVAGRATPRPTSPFRKRSKRTRRSTPSGLELSRTRPSVALCPTGCGRCAVRAPFMRALTVRTTDPDGALATTRRGASGRGTVYEGGDLTPARLDRPVQRRERRRAAGRCAARGSGGCGQAIRGPVGAAGCSRRAARPDRLRTGMAITETSCTSGPRRAIRHSATTTRPVTPLLGWLGETIFGESPRGLRVLSAVAVAVVVVFVALLARELGAGPGGQVIAAAGTAGAARPRCGAPVEYVDVRSPRLDHDPARRRPDPRRRRSAALAPRRRRGRRRAREQAAAAPPRLLTGDRPRNRSQARSTAPLAVGVGWRRARGGDLASESRLAGRARMATARARSGYSSGRRCGEPRHALSVSAAPREPVPDAAARGRAWGALPGRATRPWRSLGIAYAVLLVLLLATGVQALLCGAVPVLPARRGLGPVRALAVDPRAAARPGGVPHRQCGGRSGDRAAGASGGPPRSTPRRPQRGRDRDRRPELVGTAGRVFASLPAAEQATAVVFAGNYGEAGAVDRYGPEYGIRRAYSGHNAYARFGVPNGSAGPVIVLGDPYPFRVFEDCRASRPSTTESRSTTRSREGRCSSAPAHESRGLSSGRDSAISTRRCSLGRHTLHRDPGGDPDASRRPRPRPRRSAR